jgi:pimeloyl-ACP methyl ester carboxylesterase
MNAPTTLVLLPGLDGTGVLFESFVAALPSSITAHVIRYPGNEVKSYDELLPYIQERLPEGEFAVLGESFSGPLALRLAEQEPRVIAVILCATFLRNPMRNVPTGMARVVSPFWFRLFPLFARAKTLLGGYSTPELRAMLARAHELVTPHVFASRVREIVRLDARDALVRCKVPVMYLAGANDGVVRRHNAEEVKRLRPDVELVSIPAPHLVLQTAPQEAAKAIANFLERTATSV